jgi:hypothetical protein
MSQPLLNGEVEYVEAQRIDIHGERITELEDQVANLNQKLDNVKRDAVLALLQMLSDSMRQIASGKMDIPESVDIPAQPPNKMSSAWQKWIDKFGATSSKGMFISSLLEHGQLNARQLQVHIGVKSTQAVYNVALGLNKLSLIRKNGEMYTLVG